MIVVVGSRHDPVAADLVRRWPSSALCDALDLVAPGWRWTTGTGPGPDDRRWVVDGDVVFDADVSGVFVRRSAVYGDELLGTHRDDRAYLAAEALALLVCALATTAGVVVNPVHGGAIGVDALRPERWLGVAAGLGVPVAPLRCRSGSPSTAGAAHEAARPESMVEVVGGEASAGGELGDAAVAVADALGLRWAVAGFDAADRLCVLTTTPAPSPEAAARLGALLADPAGRAA